MKPSDEAIYNENNDPNFSFKDDVRKYNSDHGTLVTFSDDDDINEKGGDK